MVDEAIVHLDGRRTMTRLQRGKGGGWPEGQRLAGIEEMRWEASPFRIRGGQLIARVLATWASIAGLKREGAGWTKVRTI